MAPRIDRRLTISWHGPKRDRQTWDFILIQLDDKGQQVAALTLVVDYTQNEGNARGSSISLHLPPTGNQDSSECDLLSCRRCQHGNIWGMMALEWFQSWQDTTPPSSEAFWEDLGRLFEDLKRSRT